jgi:hypothetical protein
MKAGRPNSRKMRAMPAWIIPAVWVPGSPGSGPGQSLQAIGVRVGQHLGEGVADRADSHSAHQTRALALPGLFQPQPCLMFLNSGSTPSSAIPRANARGTLGNLARLFAYEVITSRAGKSGSVQISRRCWRACQAARDAPVPPTPPSSGYSNGYAAGTLTSLARTTLPFRKRAATRQRRQRNTASLP